MNTNSIHRIASTAFSPHGQWLQGLFQNLVPGSEGIKRLSQCISHLSRINPVYFTIYDSQMSVGGVPVKENLGIGAALAEHYMIWSFYFYRANVGTVESFFNAVLQREPIKHLISDEHIVSQEQNVHACANARKIAGDIEGALEFFQMLYPSPQRSTIISGLLQEMGKSSEACKILEESLAFNSEDVRSLTKLGYLLLAQGRHRKALACLEKCLQQEPENKKILTAAGKCHFEMEQFPEAEECFKRALVTSPDDGIALYFLVTTLLSQERLGEARKYIEQGLKDSNQKVILECLEAKCLVHEGKQGQAHALLDRLFEKTNFKNLEEMNSIGRYCHELGFYSHAINIYERMLEIDPHQIAKFKIIGFCHMELENTHEAIDSFRSYLGHNPNDIVVLCAISNLLVESGEYGEAIDCLEKAVKSDPKNIRTMGFLASCYCRIGDYRRVVEISRSILEINPGNKKSLMMLGHSCLKLGNANAARRFFDRLPEVGDGNRDLGIHYFFMGEPEKAVELLDDGGDDKSFQELKILGRSYRQTGNFERAVHYLKLALSKKPWIRAIRYLIGDSLVHLGRFKEAIEYFDDNFSEGGNIAIVKLLYHDHKTNSLDTSERLYERFVERYPDCMLAKIVMAAISYTAGKYEMAMDVSDQLMRIELTRGYAIVQKAECLRKLKRYSEAIELFQLVLDQEMKCGDSDRINALNGIAYCCLEVGKLFFASDRNEANDYFNFAICCLNQALELEKQNNLLKPRTFSGFGFVYLMLSESTSDVKKYLNMAKQYFAKALDLEPRNPKALSGMQAVEKAMLR